MKQNILPFSISRKQRPRPGIAKSVTKKKLMGLLFGQPSEQLANTNLFSPFVHERNSIGYLIRQKRSLDKNPNYESRLKKLKVTLSPEQLLIFTNANKMILQYNKILERYVERLPNQWSWDSFTNQKRHDLLKVSSGLLARKKRNYKKIINSGFLIPKSPDRADFHVRTRLNFLEKLDDQEMNDDLN